MIVLVSLNVHVAESKAGPCPPGYQCHGELSAFMKAIKATCVHQDRQGECNQWTPAKLALICDPHELCQVTGSRVKVGSNVSVVLQSAILANNEHLKGAGALMIVSGEVLGTRVSYVNGSALDVGVYMDIYIYVCIYIKFL